MRILSGARYDTLAPLHHKNESVFYQILRSETHDSSTLSGVERVKLYDAINVLIGDQSSNGLSFAIVE